MVLNTFKQITAATASPLVVNLPSTNSLLSVSVADMDGGTPRVAWSKVRGAGNVSFSPNGTATSSNCLASFDTAGSYVLQAAVVDGSILDSNIWITYNLGYPGRDFQTYTNYYGAVYSNVTVTVSDGTVHTNLPPVALPQSVSVAANSAQAITLLGFDPEGYALIYTVASSPAHGTLSGHRAERDLHPGGQLPRPGQLTFTVTDSEGAVSPPATVALTVCGPATGGQRAVCGDDPNTAKAITLTGSNTAVMPLTYAIVSFAGSRWVERERRRTSPTRRATDYIGADSFTFKVNNGLADSPAATVSISVAAWQGMDQHCERAAGPLARTGAAAPRLRRAEKQTLCSPSTPAPTRVQVPTT